MIFSITLENIDSNEIGLYLCMILLLPNLKIEIILQFLNSKKPNLSQ